MSAKKIIHSFLLMLTAMIWGLSFVAQSVGMDYIDPYTFNCVRSIIGGITLIPVVILTGKNSGKKKKSGNDSVVIGGICCGVFLFGGMTLQQIGIQYTTVGKAGFITACYIVLVPIVSFVLLRKRCGITVWCGVLFGIIGLYLLCIKDGFVIGKGDSYVFLCAVMFTFHILVIDYFNTKADPIKMSMVQFFVCGALSAVFMFMYETPNMAYILKAWQPLLCTGVLSTGVGYTLQIVGQEGMNPTVASLILSMESVFSVVGGYLILHQQFSNREMIGCVLMLVAIILAQIPSGKKN